MASSKVTILNQKELAEEPIKISEVKEYMRVLHDYEDGLIDRLITAAREEAEKFLGISLTKREIVAYIDSYQGREIILPRGPVCEIIELEFKTPAMANFNRIPPNYSMVDGRLVLQKEFSYSALKVKYSAGFGGDYPLPNALKQALILHVSELYHNRNLAELCMGVLHRLYHSFRRVLI